MKQVLAFLTAMGIMYLSASFVSLNFDFHFWSKIIRCFYGVLSPLLSFLFVMMCDDIFFDNKEVITRDPKTGRFKKC
jgi:hypothetical protein